MKPSVRRLMVAALVATFTLIGDPRTTFGGLYVVDDFAVMFKVFFLTVLVQGVNRVSGMMATVQKMEKWIKWTVPAVFIIVGIYYIVIVYGPMI